VKKNLLPFFFFYSQKLHKIENYFIFEKLKKKIWANLHRQNYRTFYPKNVTKLSKFWVRDPVSGIKDPGSGKNLFRIPDPGVKKAPDPGSATLLLAQTDTQRRTPACLCQNIRVKKTSTKSIRTELCPSRSNYELLNHSNFNTCYWSSNYSDCWHPDLPSNRSWGMVLKCTVEMGNIEQVFNFTVKLKIVRDVL